MTHRDQRHRTFYVTYEVGHQRGAKRLLLDGVAHQWKVGSFELESGRRIHGLQLYFETHVGQFDIRLVELPREARNVELHAGALPLEFQNAPVDEAA